MKLIATLRNFFNSNIFNTPEIDAAPNAKETEPRSIEVMEVAGSRGPRPRRVRRQRRFGRNA